MDPSHKPTEPEPQPPLAERPRTVGTVVWSSEEILKGTKEIQIVHHSEIYRLRLTRNGKLILSK